MQVLPKAQDPLSTNSKLCSSYNISKGYQLPGIRGLRGKAATVAGFLISIIIISMGILAILTQISINPLGAILGIIVLLVVAIATTVIFIKLMF